MDEIRKEGLLVAGVRQSVGDVRRWLGNLLGDDPRLYDCQLCVAELMTNALRYTDSGKGGRILVMVRICAERLRVEVTDDGGGVSVPYLRDPGPARERGRGLRIVEALVDEWGVERANPGHTVWFTIGLKTTSPGLRG